MALAGNVICSAIGIDSTGGYSPSLDAIVAGIGYAAPPIMALLFILDDEVVKVSPHARAIRDVEDEELRSFFYGMSPLQGALADVFLRGTELVTDVRGMAALAGVLPPFVPFAQAFAAVITAALTGSLYYVAASPKDPTYIVAPVLSSRSGRDEMKKLFAAWYERRQMKKIYSPLLEGLLALYLGFEWNQGALADVFLRGTELVTDVSGMAALAGVLPPFVPFAQAFAAVITAALTGSLYYVAASPKDPTYIVAPVLSSRSGRDEMKKLFAAWYERRQMKKIYSPLLEGLLALYLGFEWNQTNNILAPIITHGIYSATILGHGLWKIHDHRRRLQQRIQELKLEEKNSRRF
nr:CAAX amino terminal protease [Tanacetum cinerariifolium]